MNSCHLGGKNAADPQGCSIKFISKWCHRCVRPVQDSRDSLNTATLTYDTLKHSSSSTSVIIQKGRLTAQKSVHCLWNREVNRQWQRGETHPIRCTVAINAHGTVRLTELFVLPRQRKHSRTKPNALCPSVRLLLSNICCCWNSASFGSGVERH